MKQLFWNAGWLVELVFGSEFLPHIRALIVGNFRQSETAIHYIPCIGTALHKNTATHLCCNTQLAFDLHLCLACACV